VPCNKGNFTLFFDTHLGRSTGRLEQDTLWSCALARPVSNRPDENRKLWTRPKAIKTHSEYVLLLVIFHCRNGYTNAPQCYGMCTVQSIGEQTTKTTKKDKIWDDTDLTDQFPSPYLPATKKYLHRESVD